MSSGSRAKRLRESLARWLCFACAAISVLTTDRNRRRSPSENRRRFSVTSLLWQFLDGARVDADVLAPARYGILPLVCGNHADYVRSSDLSHLPVWACSRLSIYRSTRPFKVRRALKPALELLAGVPTVVYGYFGIAFVTPASSFRCFPMSRSLTRRAARS